MGQVGDEVPLILIVDDTVLNLQLLAACVQQSGWRPLCADRGSLVAGLIASDNPQLVLLDVRMPAPDGIAVLKDLRSRYNLVQLPIIMVSADTDMHLIGEALAAGANDYITKPIEYVIVEARIKTQLSLRSAAARLEEANRRLTELDELKSRFVSAVSHELRTPLAAIHTAVGLLSEGALGPIVDDQRESLELIQRNVQRLRRMIQQWLDAAVLGAEKVRLSLRPMNMNAVLVDAKGILALRAHEKGSLIHLELPDTAIAVRGDPDALVQVVLNLGGNALQHNPPGTEVRLSLCVRGNEALISISDNGSGMPEEELDRLFEWFTRTGTPRPSSVSGYGLGLAVTQEILRAQGSMICIDTAPEGGMTFSFRLPLATENGDTARDIEATS